MKPLISVLKETVIEKSNLDDVLEMFKKNLRPEFKYVTERIENFVRGFIQKRGYNVKFLNACTSYAGVRTKDTIIICSPNKMMTLGDFLYTIFHEIRHEQQISTIKMPNPLSDMDLDDFENLYKQYWEMELDADQYAKNMLVKIAEKLGLTRDEAKSILKLSGNIEEYPQRSDMTRKQIRGIIDNIKQMRASGQKYEDIKDHPFIKMHLSKLERFI